MKPATSRVRRGSLTRDASSLVRIRDFHGLSGLDAGQLADALAAGQPWWYAGEHGVAERAADRARVVPPTGPGDESVVQAGRSGYVEIVGGPAHEDGHEPAQPVRIGAVRGAEHGAGFETRPVVSVHHARPLRALDTMRVAYHSRLDARPGRR
jgi:hypothetical protein